MLELHAQASERQHRELGAFVRYCVFRIEREFGELRWLVKIVPAGGSYTCFVAVHIKNQIVEAHGAGFDGVFAAWDALSNAEQALRDTRRDRDPIEQRDHVSAWEPPLDS